MPRVPQSSVYWCSCGSTGFAAVDARVCVEAGCEALEVYGVIGDPLPVTTGFWRWVREGISRSLGLEDSVVSRLAPGGVALRVKREAIEVAWSIVYNGGVAGILEYDWFIRTWVFSPRGWLASLLYRERLGYAGVLRVKARRGDVLPWSVYRGEASDTLGSRLVARDETGRIVVLRVEREGLRVEHIEAFREDAEWPKPGLDWPRFYDLHWRARVEALYREAVEWSKKLLTRYRSVLRLSGGKDSSVAAIVFAEAGGRDAIYSSIDWEFGATRETVEKVGSETGLSVEVLKPSRSCWELLEVYGPPGRDYRWCTQACKLGPVRRHVRERGYDVVFTGNRALESPGRAREGRLSKSRGAGGGLVASPLYNWTAVDVFTVLWRKGLPINPLYEEGYERVGCFNCPSQSIPELMLSSRIERRSWDRWAGYLSSYARRRDLPRLWLELHLWRWRFKPPRRVAEAARRLGVRWDRLVERTWVTRVVEAGGEVIAVRLHTEAGKAVTLNDIRLLAPAVGAIWSITGDHIVVKPSRYSMIVFYEDGDVYVESPSLDEAEELAENGVRVVAAAATCTGCMLCTDVCPNDAIRVLEARKPVVDVKRCIACAKCVRVCPLASLALLSEKVGLQASIEARMEKTKRGH